MSRTGAALGRLLLVFSLVLLSACSRRDPCAELEANPPVDPALLAFLSRARAAHHAADGFEERKEVASAARVLREVASGPFPGASPEHSAEVREVLADTLARLADLESRQGNFESARADVGRGLELAREPSYFRGHLYEVSGLMWERKARALRERGDESAAKEANDRALEQLEAAMKIQAQVIAGSTPLPKSSR